MTQSENLHIDLAKKVWLTPNAWETMGYDYKVVIVRASENSRDEWRGIVKEGEGREAKYLYSSLSERHRRLCSMVCMDGLDERSYVERWIEEQKSEDEKRWDEVRLDAIQRPSISDQRFIDKTEGLTEAQRLRMRQELAVLGFIVDVKAGSHFGFWSNSDMWKWVISYIKEELWHESRSGKRACYLPTSYCNLTAVVKRYRKEGPACRLPKNMKNKARAKLPEIGKDLLIELFADWRNQPATTVRKVYNKWASENGHSEIAASTVRKFRLDNLEDITLGSMGMKAWQNAFGKQIHRKPVSSPLFLVNSDDNDLDLYFKTDESRYKRVVLILVVDAYARYPLGYAVGERQTKELVREAYRNAALHVRELTGSWHGWHEIKADRWGIGVTGKKKDGTPRQMTELEQYYRRQAHFTPPRAGWARSKIVESCFGNDWHRILKANYPNYAGHNVTAKRKMNKEELARRSADFPFLYQADELVEDFIGKLRQLPVSEKDSRTRQSAWLKGWERLADSDRKRVSESEALLWWGEAHEYTNELTIKGLQPTIEGETLTYDVPEHLYMQNVGRKFQCHYMPEDMSRALFVSEDGKERMLLQQYERVAHSLKDREQAEGERIADKMAEQRRINQDALNRLAERRARLEQERLDAESLLQSGEMGKEAYKRAQRKLQEPQTQPQQKKSPWDYL